MRLRNAGGHAHYTTIFAALAGFDDSDSHTQRVVQFYDTIGAQRREHTLAALQPGAAPQPRTFMHLMLLSDLKNAATGCAGYACVPAAMRSACLRTLIEALTHAAARLQLVVAEDGAVEGVKAQLRSWGALFVLDDQFAVWRDHAGNLTWSTHATVIGDKLRLLHSFRSRATYADHGAVVVLLRGLLKRIEARPQRRQQGRTKPRATPRRLRRPRR